MKTSDVYKYNKMVRSGTHKYMAEWWMYRGMDVDTDDVRHKDTVSLREYIDTYPVNEPDVSTWLTDRSVSPLIFGREHFTEKYFLIYSYEGSMNVADLRKDPDEYIHTILGVLYFINQKGVVMVSHTRGTCGYVIQYHPDLGYLINGIIASQQAVMDIFDKPNDIILVEEMPYRENVIEVVRVICCRFDSKLEITQAMKRSVDVQEYAGQDYFKCPEEIYYGFGTKLYGVVDYSDETEELRLEDLPAEIRQTTEALGEKRPEVKYAAIDYYKVGDAPDVLDTSDAPGAPDAPQANNVDAAGAFAGETFAAAAAEVQTPHAAADDTSKSFSDEFFAAVEGGTSGSVSDEVYAAAAEALAEYSEKISAEAGEAPAAGLEEPAAAADTDQAQTGNADQAAAGADQGETGDAEAQFMDNPFRPDASGKYPEDAEPEFAELRDKDVQGAYKIVDMFDFAPYPVTIGFNERTGLFLRSLLKEKEKNASRSRGLGRFSPKLFRDRDSEEIYEDVMKYDQLLESPRTVQILCSDYQELFAEQVLPVDEGPDSSAEAEQVLPTDEEPDSSADAQTTEPELGSAPFLVRRSDLGGNEVEMIYEMGEQIASPGDVTDELSRLFDCIPYLDKAIIDVREDGKILTVRKARKK